MMGKRMSKLIALIIIIMLTSANISYAQTTTNILYIPSTDPISPYGPQIEDLQNKEDILKNLEDIKRIRGNLIVININENSTTEELKEIDKDIDFYIQQLETIKKNLDNHKLSYKDSFPDLFFSEQILLIVDSYIISLRQQQNLIRSLETNKAEARKLFYSSYLIPVYYYLTLGDQMVAYIDTYFTLS